MSSTLSLSLPLSLHMTKSIKRILPLLLVVAMVTPFYLPLPALALETQDYDLRDFTEVSTSANIKMVVTVGEDFAVSAKGSTKVLERLKLRVDGDRLEAGWKPNKGWGWNKIKGTATVSVTLPALTLAKASSNGSIKASGISADDFTAKASSNAKITISGTCETFEGRASSNAAINAKELLCDTAEASASSNGDVSVYATKSVNGYASSNGDVYVYGNPANIAERTSSNGRVAEK